MFIEKYNKKNINLPPIKINIDPINKNFECSVEGILNDKSALNFVLAKTYLKGQNFPTLSKLVLSSIVSDNLDLYNLFNGWRLEILIPFPFKYNKNNFYFAIFGLNKNKRAFVHFSTLESLEFIRNLYRKNYNEKISIREAKEIIFNNFIIKVDFYNDLLLVSLLRKKELVLSLQILTETMNFSSSNFKYDIKLFKIADFLRTDDFFEKEILFASTLKILIEKLKEENKSFIFFISTDATFLSFQKIAFLCDFDFCGTLIQHLLSSTSDKEQFIDINMWAYSYLAY